MDSRLINVFLLGIAFMILNIAFQTSRMLQQSVLEGVKNETINGTSFQGSGYLSFAIGSSSYAIFNIVAPAVLFVLGPSMALLVAAFPHWLFVVALLSPTVWSFYLSSVLMGIGGAVYWTGQGTYLALNSDEETISRNAGIFGALLQISAIPGNLYVYLSLETGVIYRSSRYQLFTVFSVVGAISFLPFGIMVWRSRIERRRSQQQQTRQKVTLVDIGRTLTIALRLLKLRNIQLLVPSFIYIGIVPIFLQAVYPTCIGHYIKYGDKRKRLIGLYGLVNGLGNMLGAGLFGFITKPKTVSQRALILVISFILQIISYYSIFVNTPFDAPARETDTKPYFELSSSASQAVAFVTSFLVGLGNSGSSIQLTSVLAGRYKKVSASAFALNLMIQGVMGTIYSLYIAPIGLQFQLSILTVLLFGSTLTLFGVLFNEVHDELSEIPSIFGNNEREDATNIQHCNSSLASE